MRHAIAQSHTPLQGFSLPRSLAIAATAVLHLLVLAVLMRPMTGSDPAVDEAAVVTGITWMTPPPRALPVPPAPPRPVVPKRPQTPAQVATTPTITAPSISAATPMPGDMPSEEAEGEPTESAGIESGGEVGLLVRSAPPPRYPREAIRARLEGEVELLILVGVDGRPESVSISRSSGHAALDRAAREQVKRRWVFVPLQRNGVPVSSWARVPVRFSLPD